MSITLSPVALVISIVAIANVGRIGAFEMYKCSGVKACETPTNKAEGLWYLTWASRAGEKNLKTFFKNTNCGVFKNCNDCNCLATYFVSGDEKGYVGYSISSNIKEKKTYVKSFLDQQVTSNNLVFHKCIINDEAILPYNENGYVKGTDFETSVVGDFYKYVLLDTDNNQSWRLLIICEDTKDICKSAQPLVLLYTKSKNPGKLTTMKQVLDSLKKNGLNAHELELTYFDNNGCRFPQWQEFDRCKWGCNCMKPPKK